MTYRGLIFFDLDGTLLDEHSQITHEVAQATHTLIANNYLPVIATGRSPLEIQDVLKATGITSFISLNGSFIEVNGQPIYRGTIETSAIQRIVDVAAKKQEAVSFYDANQIVATRQTPELKEAYSFIHTPIPKTNADYFLSHDIYMLLILTKNNDQAYHDAAKGAFTFYRNGPFSIDTVKRGESKRNGIEQLVKTGEFDGIPTYAFGDGPNDLPMLEFVDHAVAMGNGRPNVKDAAEFVTTANTNSGIVNGLQHFDLL